jgi:sugar lactone lactonase YvrE
MGQSENYLPEILETWEPEKHATGFVFAEGPLWHPDGFYFFADVRGNTLYKWTPGVGVEKVRDTIWGNGTTFDLQGRLIQCEGPAKRLSRLYPDGRVEYFADNVNGARINRPNDVICKSDGTLMFTDPSYRVPFKEREIPGEDNPTGIYEGAAIYQISPEDDTVSHVVSCEYPNGLAFSPDERTLYVANTRTSKFMHRIDFDADGKVIGRGIFADMNGSEPGSPDGVKVDQQGRVLCSGPGGIWVFDPDGTRLGIIRFPEPAVNFAYGGDDLQTLFVCAHTSIYTVRMKVPGLPHPWYALHKKSA